MNEKQIAKLLSNLLTKFKEKYFTPLEKRLEPLETHIKDFTPFDDSELQAKIKAIPEYEAFDPSQLEEKIDAVENYVNDVNDTLKAVKPYDDSTLINQIAEIDVYDDSELREQIKAIKPYDDSDIQELIHAVKKDVNSIEIPMEFDPSALEKHIAELEDAIPTIPEIPAPYDDAELVAKIEQVEKAIPTIPEIPAPYDDAELLAKIEQVEKAIPTIPEIPKEYDDSALQKSVDTIREVQQEIQKELARPITISLGEAKAYESKETEKGTVVLHNNNVYVNRIDGNDSEPSEINKSYRCIMKAPKDIVHTGVWDSEKEYQQNEIAMWNNNSYIWVGEKGNVEPNTSDKWKILSKGIRGRTGKQGESGEAVTVDYSELLQKQDDEITILKAQVKELLDATRTN